MPKTISSTIIKGTTNVEYNLDEMINDSRTNSNETLVIQVYKYRKGESPNPSNLKDGQIWLSKLVEDED